MYIMFVQDLASLKLPDSPSKAGMLAENVKKNRLSTVIPGKL